jgi:hypothetical protein
MPMLSLCGSILIAIAISDILQTVFRPFGSGFGSAVPARVVWRLLRTVPGAGPHLLRVAGPAIMVGVIVVWVVMLLLGWALIYWDAGPSGFSFGGPDAARPAGFLGALYLSMITLSTVGFGDLVPATPGMRLVAALQGLVGFSMITVCITWILSVYPVLTRRRTLAYEIALLSETAQRWDLHLGRLGEHVEGVLGDLTRALSGVHSDLQQFPHTYYFHSHAPRFELAAMLPRLVVVARAAAESSTPVLRFQADLLTEALRDLGRTLARDVGGDADRDLADVLARYARDHGFAAAEGTPTRSG